MPLFLVEGNFSKELQMTSEDFHQINQITDEIGAHSKLVGLPADVIVEVSRFWPQ